MDLTWKDKLSYNIQEWRGKLPYAGNSKRQNVLLVFAGVCLIFLITAGFSLLASSNGNKKVFNLQTSSANNSNNSNNLGQTASKSNTSSSATDKKLNGVGGVIKGIVPSKYSTILTGTIPPPKVLFSQNPSFASNSNKVKNAGSSSSSNNNNNQGSAGSSNNSSNNTDLSKVILYFQDPNGNLQQYVAPTAAPANLSWETYVNNSDYYTIEIPVNWQVVRTFYNGHEGVSIYPSGMNTALTIQDGLEAIGFGVSQYDYQVPYINQSQASSIAPITIDGYSGTIYTQGSFGMNTVAAIIRYGNYYFGIGATANSSETIYIFQHMLSSLQLYG